MNNCPDDKNLISVASKNSSINNANTTTSAASSDTTGETERIIAFTSNGNSNGTIGGNQTYKTNGKYIKILCNSGSHRDGSSRVKLKNIVDYKWEIKHYPGHLICVHIDGNHIAYVIKATNKVNGIEEGMVRVVNIANDQRTLIKGMSGEVLDLQFALIERIHILACIDHNSLYIHKIDMLSHNLICNLLLKIEDPLENYLSKYNKVAWCPNFPDSNSNGTNDNASSDDEEDDVSQLIVWSRGKIFQCFNVSQIIITHGIGTHLTKNLTDGYLQSVDNVICITWTALSPDGTTLGVGSEDGFIRFYQIYFHEKEPRCLHQWNPHQGKPISSFFFLDNLKNWKSTSDTFWKYALTACSNNTEFKIWDCGTWECQQQIILSPMEPHSKLNFIAEMDLTSQYLILSNVDSRTLYVMNIMNTPKMKGGKLIKTEKLGKKSPCLLIRSVSEFPISLPILSFSILGTTIKVFKCATNENYLLDDDDDFDEENNPVPLSVLRMFLVQPKSVQECSIFYQPILDELEDEDEEDENHVTTDTTSSSCLVQNAGELYSSIVKNPNLLQKIKQSISDDEDVEDDEEEEEKNSLSSTDKEEFDEQQNLLLAKTILEESLKKSPLPLIPSLTALEASPEAPPASVLNQFSSPHLMTPEAFSQSHCVFTSAPQFPSHSGFSNNSQFNNSTQPIYNTQISGRKNSPAEVNTNVFNTILMLANVSGASNTKQPELLNLVNNKMIEDQQKLRAADKQHQQTKFIAIDQKAMEPADSSSPPSREVQEIMGLSEQRSQYQYENEKFDLTSLSEAIDATEFKKKQPISTEWPKFPDIKTVSKPTVPTLTSVSTSTTQIKTISQSTCTEGPPPPNELVVLTTTLNQLIHVIQVQSGQIQSLEKEINQLKFRDNSLATIDSIQTKLEEHIQRIFEKYLSRVEQTQCDKFQEFLTATEMKNCDLRERMQSNNQIFFNQLVEKVSQTLKLELQRSVVPVLAGKLDVIQRQIQSQVTEKLNATDQALVESISQLCKSKNMIDTFGKSVLHGVQGSLQAAFIESMSSTLIPAYEKSSQQMFRQLHETFSMGIKEVMEQFDNYLTQLQPVQDTTDEILNRVVKFREHLDSINGRQAQIITENYTETKKEIKSLELNFIRHFSEIIRKEIRKNFETQVASLEDSVLSAVRSQAATPAPNTVYDLQDQIKQLLGQGQINLAFNQALLANDLSLVEFTLEKADYKNVFNPCRLEQTVLLSLIQQISADMSNHNELKQTYLADGILNLNLNDPITKEHSPKVLKDLYRNCQSFLQNNIRSSLCSNIRMVMMAIQGMGHKFL